MPKDEKRPRSSYLDTPAFKFFKARIPWLLLLMFTATFTSIIISTFESALASKVVLTAFIPMLMGTGGNCGAQSSVTVIRSLSLGTLKNSDFFRVVLKEFKIAFLCGFTLSAFEFLKLIAVDRFILGSEVDIYVALVVSLTLFATVLVAKLIGASLPLLANAFKIDPAVMASPFITTLVDTISLCLYFLIASVILNI